MVSDEVWEERWRSYGILEMVSDMREVFAPQRAMEIFTWMVAFGTAGGDTHAEMVRRLIVAGFTKSAVYNASNDIKKFQAHLKEKWGVEPSRYELTKKVLSMGSMIMENAV